MLKEMILNEINNKVFSSTTRDVNLSVLIQIHNQLRDSLINSLDFFLKIQLAETLKIKVHIYKYRWNTNITMHTKEDKNW